MQMWLLHENAKHFLMDCNLYTEHRTNLFQKLEGVCDPSLDLLLYGDPDLTPAQNELVFEAVHDFLTSTERFV